MPSSVSSNLCCSAGGVPGAVTAHHPAWGKDQIEGRKESGGVHPWSVLELSELQLPEFGVTPARWHPFSTLFSALVLQMAFQQWSVTIGDQQRWTDGLYQISRRLQMPSARARKQREVCTSDAIYEGLAKILHTNKQTLHSHFCGVRRGLHQNKIK